MICAGSEESKLKPPKSIYTRTKKKGLKESLTYSHTGSKINRRVDAEQWQCMCTRQNVSSLGVMDKEGEGIQDPRGEGNE